MGVNVTSSKFGMWGLSSGMLGMLGMPEREFVYIVLKKHFDLRGAPKFNLNTLLYCTGTVNQNYPVFLKILDTSYNVGKSK